MIRYLLHHRIAVAMAFLALVILGCLTYRTLPVSLLPDIAIPHITVQVCEENTSARELESTVTAPLRRQLMQTGGLSEIKSGTRDGAATISLTLNYGVDTDLAFIEVNEKIDGAMNSLPKTLKRPKAIKASATDIPALYIQLTPKKEGEEAFLETAQAAENIIRRRLEQLPEVSMADITGVPERLIKVILKPDKCSRTGITAYEIENALIANNSEPGSMTVKEGHYEYNITVTNLLRCPEDIKEIKLMKNGRMSKLSDLADVELTNRSPQGFSLFNGKRSVMIAVIKHGEESMEAMKEAISEVLEVMEQEYPMIDFAITRDQTALLDFTISNLKQNLILSLLLVFVVCILFMGSIRTSVIIGISILVSIVLTFLFFYFFHVSLNIISLAGLILAIGMMIDNSIIVTENIMQWRQRGLGLEDACIRGTNEMITPMLSSSLTTVAVFIPLVFMSGISGAIFADQAFSITAGLAASYIVGICLLPVVYYTVEKGKAAEENNVVEKSKTKTSRIEVSIMDWYDRTMDLCFKYRVLLMALTLLTVPLCVLLFTQIGRERMPEIDTDETIAVIDWNENISLQQNKERTETLLGENLPISQTVSSIGLQDYMLAEEGGNSQRESEVYIKAANPDSIKSIQRKLSERIIDRYPDASLEFRAAENIFEKVFSSDAANVELRLHNKGSVGDEGEKLINLIKNIGSCLRQEIQPVPMNDQTDITIDRELLAIYGVDFAEVSRTLEQTFKGTHATTMRSMDQYTPIEIAGVNTTIQDLIANGTVRSKVDDRGECTEIPLRKLVTLGKSRDLKTITAGKSGIYIPLSIDAPGNERETMECLRKAVNEDGNFDVEFAGSYFSNSKMLTELCRVLLVSLLLMYFILCSQFGSFLQPLIVLVEIPIDTAFALVALMLFGQTLNLMSAIGIIVTCGIIVNDSILKIDSINKLRRDGMPLMEAVHTTGRRRLRPIIMTSLTTVFAMVPVLFTSDMGSELQRPLAIAMISSMTIGTLVSIFIIPLFYIKAKHNS